MAKIKVPLVEQMEHSECGLACLSMILGYFGQYTSLVQIRETFGVPRGGSSFYQMLEIAQYYGLESKAMKGDCRSLEKNAFPILAHWEGKHYVVVETIKKRRVRIVDPAKGRQIMPLQEFLEKYTGYFITFKPQENFQTNKRPAYIGFYLSFALENRRWLLAILGISLFLQSLGLIVPFTTQWITDTILSADANMSSIVGGGILAAFLFYGLFSVCRGYFIAKLQTRMDNSMMSKFISHLFRLPYSFFQNRPGGELVYRANSNIMIRQILSGRLISFLIDGILLVTYAALMLWQSLEMGMVVIALGISIVLFLIGTTRITRELTNKEVNAQANVQSMLSENIHGICDVKVMGIENKVFNFWKDRFDQQLRVTEKKSIWTSFLDTVTSSVQFILPLFLLWYGSSIVLTGDMTTGQLLGFNALATVFIIPLVSIGAGYSELMYLVSYLQRIYDVVESQPEHTPELMIETRPCVKGKIAFKNVSFQYDYFSKPVVSDLNFTIQPKEKIAIVGPSGSGKSTIAKLILGLYKPTTGEIELDGIPLDRFDPSLIRDKIGAVLQETRLFNQTIARNIYFRKTGEFSEEEYKAIMEAAQSANIHEDIMSTPLGYNTTLSEAGVNFSGGQRQRLLLARALMDDPAILILDEATSALDALSERQIKETMDQINTTQVMIAHRLSTIQDADRIFVVNQGKIVEEGSHEELLRHKGLYYNLYQSQERKGESPLEIA
jgi:ABC-type bacteriocin/lantibiotic exporter with double-glycine peptidase domain